MTLEFERKVNIAHVPKEYQMLVLQYRSLIKMALYFAECFSNDMSFINAKRLEKAMDKMMGAEKIINLLFNAPGFCLPTNVLRERQEIKEKISHLQ